MQKEILIAVGIIKNNHNEILIIKRPNGSFMANFWELPGGKIKAKENEITALARELKEELNINVLKAKFCLKISHQYPDRNVLVSVFSIVNFNGNINNNEGHKLAWLDENTINNYRLLPTMYKVINFIKLSPVYWITPDDFTLEQLQKKLLKGLKLVQFRNKGVMDNNKQQLLISSIQLCKQYGAKILLNIAKKYHNKDLINKVDGLHLGTNDAKILKTRNLNVNKLLAVSAHNKEQLQQAFNLNADFALLSSINITSSHKNITPLGWDNAKKIINNSPIPIFALGGVSTDDLSLANKTGFFGVAGISKILL